MLQRGSTGSFTDEGPGPVRGRNIGEYESKIEVRCPALLRKSWEKL